MGKGAPHAGFPEAALPKYAQKLVELGYKVGVVEQMETPDQLKERNAKLPNGKKEYTLPSRKWVEYKGVRFYNGDRVVVIKRWLHRVDDDASGLTFVEWDPTTSTDADANQPPVEMILNSSELRAAGFKLKDLLPPELEASARAGKRTRGAGLRQLQGMGPTRFVLTAVCG